MSKIPYFTVSANSFEKNAGYKTTVHAINELIDNAYEAEASIVTIVLEVNTKKNLTAIYIADNGKGMEPNLLQRAICEKSGTNMDRQYSSGKQSRAKYGKYGVGLPKASISQCNKFSVYSWINNGPNDSFCNGIDITDENWISDGAQIEASSKRKPDEGLLKLIGAEKYNSGSLVLWEKLDGLSWSRARMGKRGLAPNLEFLAGRIYRKSIVKNDFHIRVVTCNQSWKIEDDFNIKPNDPLFLMKEADIPRKNIDEGSVWPEENPMFDSVGGEEVSLKIELKNGDMKEVKIIIRASMAKKNVFAKYNGRAAGNLPHGRFANKNVGISLLREGREVELSTILNNPSEPRERWFGIEVDIPHELDELLGMTNNKQAYNRLNTLLLEGIEGYKLEGETPFQCIKRLNTEDINNANCLVISEAIKRIYTQTKKDHLNMREKVVGKPTTDEDGNNKPLEEEPPKSPEGEAEDEGTKGDSRVLPPVDDPDKFKNDIEHELEDQGIPKEEAASIAARIINRGLKYTVVKKSGLGLPFFNARRVMDVYLLEINTDHEFFNTMAPFLETVTDEMESSALSAQLKQAKVAFFLMLEAWIKLELEADSKHVRNIVRMRSDWGRMLEEFLDNNEDE